MTEQPVTIELGSGPTAGVLHLPNYPRTIGVVCLTAVNHTRAGPHRLNVLLARRWAAAGIPVLRFDYGGNGDSCGKVLLYERALEDVRRGIDTLKRAVPEVSGIVLWGVCGAGPAAALYGVADSRVTGIMMANPPIHDDSELIHLQRTVERRLARWGLSGGGLRHVLSGLIAAPLAALRRAPPRTECRGARERIMSRVSDAAGGTLAWLSEHGGDSLRVLRMPLFRRQRRVKFLRALSRFFKPSLVLLSDDDDGAAAFIKTVLTQDVLSEPIVMGRMTCYPVKGGGHAFVRRAHTEEVAHITSGWLLALAECSVGGPLLREHAGSTALPTSGPLPARADPERRQSPPAENGSLEERNTAPVPNE